MKNTLTWLFVVAAFSAALLYLWFDRQAAMATQEERHALEVVSERRVAFESARAESDAAIEAVRLERERLLEENRRKDERIAALRARESEIVAERDARIDPLPSLTLEEIAAHTGEFVDGLAVEHDGLLFSEAAARENLRLLITGSAAERLVPVKDAHIVELSAKVMSAEQIAETLTQELGAERVAWGAERVWWQAQVKAGDTALLAERARGRRSKLRWFVAGAAAGAAATAYLLVK